jgi:hypothetical protein
MQRGELPLKITHHSSKFPPLWHQIPKGLVILRWREEEDRMAEGDRTVVVELELGSSDKNDL